MFFSAAIALALASWHLSALADGSIESPRDQVPDANTTIPPENIYVYPNPAINWTALPFNTNPSVNSPEPRSADVNFDFFYTSSPFNTGGQGCSFQVERYTYFNGQVNSGICIDAPGTQCVMNTATQCSFFVYSGAKCTGSFRNIDNVQIAPVTKGIWYNDGMRWAYKVPSTESIFLQPADCS